MQIPDSVHAGTVSRLKVMAGLDIAERRKPQDGRVTVRTIKGIYDLRLSVIPTINGEKVVMRLLDRNGAVKRLDNLGLDEVDFESLRLIVRRPQGIILATGPTGSGKTTMLHSLVREGLSPSQNCVTIEDPVEYYLDTAGQVPVRDKIGLTFASILRAILRQDPDIIILGEIRDFETAEVAFHAANTGHLVLSTLHTNSAVASVVRLLDFGLKPYIVAEALEAVVAQRLLRRLCAKCREPDPGSEAERVQVGIKSVPASGEIFKAKGCAECGGGGYVGRTGVYELLLIRDEVRQLVAMGAPERDLIGAARRRGFRSLYEKAMQKVFAGETTLDEVLRVLGPRVGGDPSCGECGKELDGGFGYCPNCGSATTLRCHQCRESLEASWNHCPHCGTAPH